MFSWFNSKEPGFNIVLDPDATQLFLKLMMADMQKDLHAGGPKLREIIIAGINGNSSYYDLTDYLEDVLRGSLNYPTQVAKPADNITQIAMDQKCVDKDCKKYKTFTLLAHMYDQGGRDTNCSRYPCDIIKNAHPGGVYGTSIAPNDEKYRNRVNAFCRIGCVSRRFPENFRINLFGSFVSKKGKKAMRFTIMECTIFKAGLVHYIYEIYNSPKIGFKTHRGVATSVAHIQQIYKQCNSKETIGCYIELLSKFLGDFNQILELACLKTLDRNMNIPIYTNDQNVRKFSGIFGLTSMDNNGLYEPIYPLKSAFTEYSVRAHKAEAMFREGNSDDINYYVGI